MGEKEFKQLSVSSALEKKSHQGFQLAVSQASIQSL